MPIHDPSVQEKLHVRDIAYASGAGMLMRSSMMREIGLLDEELFAYHEDLEFSWRARLAGWRVALAPKSEVFHKYEFSRSIKKYFWMERNRFIVMLRMYRIPTLLITLPAFLAMEIGLWAFAFKGGWWREKLRAYAHFLSPGAWKRLLDARRRAQELRKIGDREATKLFTGSILFQQMQPTLLTRVANPLFSLYWGLARLVIFW
jgi:GT2 family glycosyltransferase